MFGGYRWSMAHMVIGVTTTKARDDEAGVTAQNGNVIETTDLTKLYGDVVAVDHLTLRVPKGGVFGFLGPNGSGKTTTMGMLLGLVHPTSGEARIFGDPARHPATLRRVGAMVETPTFYPYLSGRANLLYFQGIGRRGTPADVDRLLDLVDLGKRAGSKYSTYSLGLAGHALVQILARVYFASRDTTTPLALTLISIGSNVVLSVLLAQPLGINGLALANSIATLLEAVLLFTLLASRARLRLVGLGVSTLKQLSASLLMGVAMFGFIRVTNLPFDLFIDPPKLVLALQTILAAAVGGLVYVAAAYLLRIGELHEILEVVRVRLTRRSAPQSPA